MASPQSHPVNDRAASESTRHRLLDAAYDVLVDEGYHAATVQNVARRANLTTGAIYANFASKHELLVQAVLRRWSRSPEAAPLRVTATAAGEEDSFGLEGLTGLLVSQLSTPPAPEHRLLTEVTGAAIRDDKAEALLRAGLERIESVALASIESAKEQGRIDRTLSTEALVAIVVNLYLGAITSKSFDLPQPPAEDVLAVLRRAFARP